MGSKKKAPPPPDYAKLAEEQSRLQNEMLQLQTTANRPNQYNPMGSVEWTQDPTTGQWSQFETWNPQTQEAYDKTLGLQSSQIGQIQELMKSGGFSGGPAMPTYTPQDLASMPQYNQASGDAYAQKFTESLLGRVRPQQQMDQEQMATKLRLQGLQPGTEAYDRAYRNLLTSQGDVTAQATLQGQLAGAGEARNIFGTELDAWLKRGQEGRDIYQTQLGGQQQGYGQAMQNYLLPWQTAQMTQGLANSIQQPDFQGFSQAGLGEAPQVMDAAQQQYAQQMQAYNEAAQSKQGKGQGIGSLVGGIGGAFFGMPQVGAALGGAVGGGIASDVNLKEDIREIDDETAYNIMLKLTPVSWAWKGTSVRDSGILAQQVAEFLPELVNRGERGLLMVNYTKLFGILLGAFRYMAKMQKEESHGPV